MTYFHTIIMCSSFAIKTTVKTTLACNYKSKMLNNKITILICSSAQVSLMIVPFRAYALQKLLTSAIQMPAYRHIRMLLHSLRRFI